MSISRTILNKLPKSVDREWLIPIRMLFGRYGARSYSQEGEDMILRYLLAKKLAQKVPGFYVDVGAYHPIIYSNTYHFYKRGWRGINIDAMPGSMKLFRKYRPRDINLEVGVSEHQSELSYFVFDEPALNTFDANLALERERNTDYRIVQQLTVPTQRLEHLLATHLPVGQPIDFMTVDVEGFDLAVLRSNDWQRYRPTFVLVEKFFSDGDRMELDELVGFMRSQRYRVVAHTAHTHFFRTDIPSPS